jgi:thiamine-phosphate pyrophosphorylase
MVHNPAGDAGDLLLSRSGHSAQEPRAARGADLLFVSPLFPSVSHPDRAALGLAGALALAQLAGVPAIALGGMNQARGEEAMAAGFLGWAAIDAWLRDPCLAS